MIMNIILGVCMYPVLPLIYFMMKSEVKKGTETFGVTFPKQQKENAGQQPEENAGRQEELKERREQIIKQYLIEMKHWFRVFAVIPLFAFLMPGFSIPFTIWMMWILIMIICFNIPYIKANGKMKEVRRFFTGQEGWQKTEEDRSGISFVDLQMTGRIFCSRWYHFLPQLLICILCGVFDYLYSDREDGGIGMILLITFTLCTLLFWGAAVWMDHQKSEVISLDSSVNRNYARAKKHLWKNFWCCSAWINTIFVFLLEASFQIRPCSWAILMIAVILESLVLILLCVQTCRKLVRVRSAYEEKREPCTETDDDSHWIWGMFYYNKKDNHTMVEKRAGFGTTVNMAKPVGMGLMLLSALTFLAMPFVCAWCIFMEYTPIKLRIEGEYLIAEQINTDYRIELEDITELSVVEQLPKPRSKVKGTGMERLSKGTWYVHDNGNCQLFLNPENHLFLRFEAEGKIYYMSAGTDEETQELIEQLNNS